MDHALVLKSISDNLASLPLLLPEILIVTTLGSVLVLALLLPQYQRYWLYPTALIGVLLAGFKKYWLGSQLTLHPMPPLCNQLLVLDPLAVFFCLLLLTLTLLLLLLMPPKAHSSLDVAYVVLLLGALLGSCLLVMAFHWLTIYLGLTLLALTSTLLIGSYATPQSAAASLKYLLYSMVTMAVMLWGVAYFYGFTNTLALSYPGLELSLQTVSGQIILTILLLCLSNVFFVLAAVPYHFWVPDVYQGASVAVVAYLSTMPKVAAVAVLLRIFHQLLPQLESTLQVYAQHGLAALALLTIIVGNAVALSQKNLHRMMAYATVAQGGLLMAGIAASSDHQVGVLYYSAVYGIMGLGAWIGIKILHDLTGGLCLQDCVGLGRKFPVLGGSITLVILSLIGLPPTAGFIGKFLLFTTLWEHMQRTGSVLFATLLVASLLSTVLSLYYYIKLPYRLFCKAAQTTPTMYNVGQGDQIILVCLAILLLVGCFTANNWLQALGEWLGS